MVALVLGERKLSADSSADHMIKVAPEGVHYSTHRKDSRSISLTDPPRFMMQSDDDEHRKEIMFLCNGGQQTNEAPSSLGTSASDDATYAPLRKFSRDSHHHVDSASGDCSEDDARTVSTRSSFLESPSMDLDSEVMFAQPSSGDGPLYPSQNHANLGNAGMASCTIDITQGESGGILNKSFSNLSEHIEAGLPPIDVVEDVAIAPKLHGDKPIIIDALVREEVHIGKEGLKTLVLQIFIPFLLAGFGMVAAGIVLDKVQDWPVFLELTEIFIMVPALLGLKGNLEMTLASRLSTQDSKRKWRIIGCNVALNQVLASGVGFLAAIFAIVMYAINHSGSVLPKNIVLLVGIALISACITSVVQDSVMIGIVLLAKRFRLNPDNIATPVAGTIGDILTLGILVGFSMLFYSAFKTNYWMVGPTITIIIFILLLPMWVFIARKEHTTRHVLLHGWLPVIVAMLVSSSAGVILERVLSSGLAFFKGLLVFQPLINGVGGNIVSVQASRIATYLHIAYTVPGHVPPGYTYCRAPCQTFCSRTSINARTARLLLLMVVPGHLIFMFVISFAHAGSTSVTLRFAVVFLVLALIQVTALLYIADILTHFVWKKALDPDSTTIPYLTALGDLLGTGLLALGFYLLWLTGNKNNDVGD